MYATDAPDGQVQGSCPVNVEHEKLVSPYLIVLIVIIIIHILLLLLFSNSLSSEPQVGAWDDVPSQDLPACSSVSHLQPSRNAKISL